MFDAISDDDVEFLRGRVYNAASVLVVFENHDGRVRVWGTHVVARPFSPRPLVYVSDAGPRPLADVVAEHEARGRLCLVRVGPQLDRPAKNKLHEFMVKVTGRDDPSLWDTIRFMAWKAGR